VQRLPLLLVVLLAAIGALSAGCGAEDENPEAQTTTVQTQPPAANKRMTSAGYDEYTTAAASFAQVNQKSLKRVKTCSKKINPEPKALVKCVGDSLTNTMQATDDFAHTLRGFTGSVAGACQTSIDGLLGYVVPYKASLQTLQHTIDMNNPAGASSSAQTLLTTRGAGQQAAAGIEKNCKPA
jgi:hypothetical protein